MIQRYIVRAVNPENWHVPQKEYADMGGKYVRWKDLKLFMQDLIWALEYIEAEDHQCNDLPNMRHCAICQRCAEIRKRLAI